MESIWSKRCTLPERPALPGNLETEIAVVGAGMAGVLIASALQEAGRRVVVLEAGRTGSGQTCGTTAKLTTQHGLIYHNLIERLGAEKAEQYALANQAALKEYHRLITGRGIDCDYTPCGACLCAPEEELEQELQAARRLGLAADFTRDLPAFLPASAAVRLGICGRHNVMNALAAASVAFRLGMPSARIGEVLEGLTRISPHRMAVSTVERSGASFTLIDDSFNANPDSMRAGLDGLMAWGAGEQTAPYRVAVLGAMLELGANDLELHRGVGEYAARCGVDAVVAVGGTADAHLDALAEAVAQGAKRAQTGTTPAHPSIDWVHDADQADAAVVRLAREHGNAVVLLKGSHVSGLSALAERWAA